MAQSALKKTRSQPRHLDPTLLLVDIDLSLLLQRERDVVPAIEKALPPERIHLERQHAVAEGDRLALQVHADLRVGLLGVRCQGRLAGGKAFC